MDILKFQICFKNQFSTSGSGQTENMQICVITRICVFSVWPFPEVENWFLKQIWNENVHISILNFYFGAFWSVFKKSKYGFLIVFSKCDLAGEGGGATFVTEKIRKKPNIPKYAQVLVVTWAKTNSVTALLSPPHPTLVFFFLIFHGFSTICLFGNQPTARRTCTLLQSWPALYCTKRWYVTPLPTQYP